MSLENILQTIDKSRVAENNIRRVTGLEVEQARRLQREYVRARNALRLRLASIPSGTFTEAQLKATLAQIEQLLRELQQVTNHELLIGAQISTEQSIEDMVKELRVLDQNFMGVVQPIPQEALLTSLEPENYLINRFESSIQTYNEKLRGGIQRILTDSIVQRQTTNQAIGKIEELMAVNEWQVARIARTELHHIYNVSKLTGMRELKEKEIVPGLKKALIHPMDSRTGDDSKKLAKMNPIVDIDQPFKFKWRGEERVFMAPPDRPNDRAILIPFKPQWA